MCARRSRRTSPEGIAHIHASFNNTIITITDRQGNALSWATSGGAGFKGSRKSTPFAAQVAAEKAGRVAVECGVKNLEVRIKGPGPGRESAVRALNALGHQDHQHFGRDADPAQRLPSAEEAPYITTSSGPVGLHSNRASAMTSRGAHADPAKLFRRLEQLNAVGIALSKETDIDRLLEAILLAAKKITNADGGTLYRVTEERTLKFEIVRNDTLGIAMGGTTRRRRSRSRRSRSTTTDGRPVTNHGRRLRRAPRHARSTSRTPTREEGFDFSGTRSFDKKTGYRSQSFLTVPMKNHENEIIGVLQLHQRQGPRHRRGRAVLGRRPAARGVAGVAGGDRADQPAADQSPREPVRIVHRSHQRGDRRQVAVYRRALRARADADHDAGGGGRQLQGRPAQGLRA